MRDRPDDEDARAGARVPPLSREAVSLADHIDWERPERIPEAVRYAVFERDNEQCQVCGTSNALHLHHVWYRSQGGSHHQSNLVTVCFRCHERVHRGDLDIQMHYTCGRWVAFVDRSP